MCGGLGEMLPNRKPDEYRDDPETETDAELICSARNLVKPLLSKVARLTRNLSDESLLRAAKFQELAAAESRISALTKEKDSALQERDRYKERVGELEARLRWALGHLPKFVTMTEDGSAYIRGTGAGGTELAGFSAEFHKADAALKGESHG